MKYRRYGYKKIDALLKAAGWLVNDKLFWRIRRREGLEMPGRHQKKGQLSTGDSFGIRFKPEQRAHTWAYDFVEARTHDGRKFRMLHVV